MKHILALKHWHLFIILWVLFRWPTHSPSRDFFHFLGACVFFWWIYAIGVYGQQQLKRIGLATSKTVFFKLQIIASILFFALMKIALLAPLLPDALSFLDAYLLVGILLGICLIATTIYTVLFSIKTLTILEMKKKVVASDYIFSFILVFLFLSGVWVLQPKANRLIYKQKA
ncbi:MAG TPA: hypothetical protein VFF27_06235 [Bacteroidia bacterium]|jgi:hypothetical protein|nr:hypothetical protein [Bacteroidia bacterium]